MITHSTESHFSSSAHSTPTPNHTSPIQTLTSSRAVLSPSPSHHRLDHRTVTLLIVAPFLPRHRATTPTPNYFLVTPMGKCNFVFIHSWRPMLLWKPALCWCS
ncbi:hypothetical protein RIF29_32959 [Crotalaria pallida]|uniref:Uncharacterized protein n=1 Tax=Crotalaria pallida TaxID=3830 RepID=A0AAN9E786_CROPI